MGNMEKEKILAFAKDFASKLYDIGWYSLDYVKIRTADITISLDYFIRLAEAENEGDEEIFYTYPEGWYESEGKLEEIVPRVAEDETIEAVLFCEGDLWETLYYCEAYGTKNAKTKATYDAFLHTVEEHDMWYEWGDVYVYLYRKEHAV